MKYLIASIITILVLFIPVYNAYAIWPFEDKTTSDNIYHGFDYDLRYDGQVSNGMYQYTWESAPERILDTDGKYKTYLYSEDQNKITFRTVHESITFDKHRCMINGLLPISTTLKTAQNGTDLWISDTLNSDVCDVDIEKLSDGIRVTAIKTNYGIVSGGTFETEYDFTAIGQHEIVYRYTNQDITKTDQKWGFTTTVNNVKYVIINGIQYEADTTKTFTASEITQPIIIKTNDGKETWVDPQNYIHNYLWAIKLEKGKVSLDYTYAKGRLALGETLEVDPSFGPTTYSKKLTPNSGPPSVNVSCNTGTSSFVVAGIQIQKTTSGSAATDPCIGLGLQWDISSVPSYATVTNSSYVNVISTVNNPVNCNINEITHNLDLVDATTAWNDIANISNGTSYISNNSWCTSTGSYDIDLGSTADSAITTALSQGRFAIGIFNYDQVRDGSTRYYIADNSKLKFTYVFNPITYQIKPMMYDNSTLIGIGTVKQKNSTLTTIKTINSTGWASFPGTSVANGYNYTIKEATNNFNVLTMWNKVVPPPGINQNKTNIFNVSCDANPDTDFRVEMNGTDYHRMANSTNVACQSNDDITASFTFTKSGVGNANITSKVVVKTIDTTNYSWPISKITYNGTNTSLSYYSSNTVANGTGIQVGKGTQTRVLQIRIVTDNVTSAPTSLIANPASDTRINLSWVAPTQIHGDSVKSYKIIRDGSTLVNSTGSTVTSYSDTTAGPSGTSHTYYACAWNRIGCSPLSNAATNSTYRPTTATLTPTTGIVGDVIQVNTTITITHASPSPVTVSNIKLYRNGTLLENRAVNVQINNGSSSSSSSFRFWNQLTTDDSYSYKIYATISNVTGTLSFGSSNFTGIREYDPLYQNALTNPNVQGLYNFTVGRYADEDGVHLQVNRMGGSLSNTWQIECIVQDNSQAMNTRNESQTWQGTWINYTNVGYFNGSWTGLVNTHAYITCFNDAKLFTTTSFTNSSLALLGIQIFDESYGAMLGVPVGIFFLAMAGAMANKRTAPTWIIVVLAMAGTMAAIGFFTLNPLVWGLALVTGLLGVLVNQKVF